MQNLGEDFAKMTKSVVLNMVVGGKPGLQQDVL
jgi:hypothetical protein